MPITKSAKKALKRSTKQNTYNQPVKNKMKDAIKAVRQKIKKGQELTENDVKTTYSAVDKALKAKIIKKKNAANKKSKIATLVNKSKKAA